MSLPVIVRPEAEADVQQVFAELEGVLAGTERRFLVRLQEVFERIEAMPQLHGIVWRDVRAARLKQFRYVVYFVPYSDRVEVLAVLHSARDPSIWQSRT